jgi:chromosome segregation ATPase
VALALTGSATGSNVTQLENKLGNTKSELNSTTQHVQNIAARIGQLNGEVTQLDGQIALMQAREADMRQRLANDEAKLAAAKVAVRRERHRLRHLRHILGHARRALADELVSQYEQPQQSLVSVIISAKGFQQLLDSLQYLSDVQDHEQTVVRRTRLARGHARAAAARLNALQRSDATAASDAKARTGALAGMDVLLKSRESALADARAAQTEALAATKDRGSQLRAAIAVIQKQVAAAEQAERTISFTGGDGLGGSAGWSIPYAIVLCESGGQNLPPNSAGASGYYQIIPSTWHDFGGTGPAAYLAPKSEQDAVAMRIWRGGAGAANWACSAIVGIT